jgi:TetR/AcrR family transcriptional regulator, transcriptional repressor for nem operon
MEALLPSTPPKSGSKPAQQSKHTPKSEKTMRRLKLATTECLRRIGYHDLKVVDICQEAGTGIGTFYFHFTDKPEICLTVFRENLATNVHYIHSAPHADDPFEGILASLKRTVETFERSGPNGNRAITEMINTLPEARLIWAQTNEMVVDIVTKRAFRAQRGANQANAAAFATYSLLQLIDGVLLNYFAWRDPYLLKLVESPEELAELLAILWYRALFGELPKKKVSARAAHLVALFSR